MKCMKLVCIVISFVIMAVCLNACMDLASNETKEKQALLKKISYKNGQVYTMRGLGGIFSRGMNRLEDTLEDDYQIRTSSTIWYKANELSDFIRKNHDNKTLSGPIILIGHSLGANEQIKVAQNLYKWNIPVALLMTIDAVAPLRVTPNVKQVFNIYKPGFVPMFSGLPVKAIDPEHTQIVNFNVNANKDVYVNHFTIDKNAAIQKIMLDKVLATMKTNDKSNG